MVVIVMLVFGLLAVGVPVGQDPATYVAALAHAGFTSVGALEGGAERLLVACDEAHRPQVRSIIEDVETVGFEGSEVRVGHVSFEDEH